MKSTNWNLVRSFPSHSGSPGRETNRERHSSPLTVSVRWRKIILLPSTERFERLSLTQASRPDMLRRLTTVLSFPCHHVYLCPPTPPHLYSYIRILPIYAYSLLTKRSVMHIMRSYTPLNGSHEALLCVGILYVAPSKSNFR